jgi:hypothetical protein
MTLMIVLSIIRIAQHGPRQPPVVRFSGMTHIFGACEFSFMAHHSIPQMVTPILNKSSVHFVYLADIILVLVFYLLLSFTAIFAVGHLMDLYTLNFEPTISADNAVTNVVVLQYILILYPVFTLSASYPVVGISLRNNIRALFMIRRPEDKKFPWTVEKIVFPVLALVVPTAVALGTNNISVFRPQPCFLRDILRSALHQSLCA